MSDRLKIDSDGLDEIVWSGIAHLEMMSDRSAFLCLTDENGADGFGVWLSAEKGKLRISWEPRGKRAKAMADASPRQAGRI